MSLLKKNLPLLLRITLFSAPLIFCPNLSDFANLPKQVFLEIIGLFLTLVWLGVQLRNQTFSLQRMPVFTWPLFFYIAWALCSSFFAFNPHEAWKIGRQWLVAFLYFFLIVQVSVSPAQRRQTLTILFSAAFLVAMLGISQHLFDLSLIPQLVPPAANFANKNMAVHFMVLLFPTGVFLFITTKNPRDAWIISLMTSLIIVYLFYTQTRAGWLAVCSEILIFTFLLYKTKQPLASHWSRQKKRAALVGLLLIAIMINIGPEGFTLGFFAIAHRASSIASIHGNIDRFAIWADTLSLIRQHPLLGVGLGNLKVYFPAVQKESLFLYTQFLNDAHNDYLQIWAELGLIGLTSFTCFVASLGAFLFKIHKKYRGDLEKSLELYALAISLGGIGINALFCFPLQRVIPLFTIMVLLGLLTSLAKEGRTCSIPKRFAAYVVVVLLIFIPIIIDDNLKAIAAEIFYLKTSLANEDENWQAVIDNGTKTLHYQPNKATPHSYIGSAYLAQNNYHEALPHLLSMLEKFPYHYYTLLNTGAAYYGLHDYQKAQEYFAKAVQVAPIAGAAHDHLGKVYLQLKEYPKALKEFNEAIRLEPEKKSTYLYNLGLVERELGQVEEAIAAFEQAIAADKRFALPHKELAMIYLQLKPDQARAAYHARLMQELSKAPAGSQPIKLDKPLSP